MRLTLARYLPAYRCLPLFVLLLLRAGLPAAAANEAHPHRLPPKPAAAPAHDRLNLFSPRVRRSTASYLRLRLLELHEEGLDRARAAIERRLRVDELLAEPQKSTP